MASRPLRQWEEGSVNEVGVVFAKDLFGELHHLDSGDNKAFLLEAGEYLAYKGAFNG